MLKFVKTLVFVMLALIVVGLGALGYGLYSRSGTSGEAAESGAPGRIVPTEGIPAPPAEPGASAALHDPAFFGMLFLDEPAGTEIRSMVVSGNTLVVELVGGPQARPNRLVVLDLATGQVRGRINLGSALH
ncbi:hypothetical protein IHV25_08415 [Phaeovibrio sulfidiphilus]|uniref:Uncharacterized protein n=1 Tax=Phaeovibrio sulfidiphilus TaxID=1220600 RepID=A0A8J6YNC0_9PROT|nr:hypothetical protein [Phaeovibrio sulfidiphilus]MBE1237670.1 hypothetical protein [Phaeovibrio sulfidiphilus]